MNQDLQQKEHALKAMEAKDAVFSDQLKQQRLIKDAEEVFETVLKQELELCKNGLPGDLLTVLPRDSEFFGPLGHSII